MSYTRRTKCTHIARFIVFRVVGILNHSYFRLYAYCLGDCNIFHRRQRGENLYPPREIFRDTPLCLRDLYPFFTHMRMRSSRAQAYMCIHVYTYVYTYVYVYRLTFINFCRRRRRMRSHKSNRALFVSLSATNASRKMLRTFLCTFLALLHDRYKVVCNFILERNCRRSKIHS